MERNLDLVFPVKNMQLASAGAGGNEYIGLTPASGELWIVDFACMLHDDNAAARVLSWNWYDGATNTVLYGTPAAVALSIYVQLYGNVFTGGKPLVCSASRYLRAGVVAAGAGKKVYLNAIVRKIRGVEPWSDD